MHPTHRKNPTPPSTRRLLLIPAALCTLATLTHAQTVTVAAGDADTTTAILWAHTETLGPATFIWTTDPAFATIAGDATTTVTDPALPVKIEATGLKPGTTYYYRFTDADRNTATGQFTTPHATGRAGLRFGVSGDWRGDLAPYPSIAHAANRQLTLFIALGDTIYADVPSPAVPRDQARTLAEFRAKHNEVYSERLGLNALGDLRAATALLALIDDHEVTNDFAGAAAPNTDPRFDQTGALINETQLFKNGLQAFHEFNPIREEFYPDTGEARNTRKRKLYRYRVYGHDAAFFLLDARSFRDEPIPNVALGEGGTDEFLAAAFDPARTMLSAAQLADLQRDLLDAESRGVTWKFIIVPEPIQNLGPFLAADRFEGYAAERTALLSFANENAIANVVFIAADIHGTVINNLTYQTAAGGPQIETGIFEVTTGAVAYAPPFGPTVLEFVNADTLGAPGAIVSGIYNLLWPRAQDRFMTAFGNILFGAFGYDRIGLGRSEIEARRLTRGYLAVHTFGWTEFDIDADTQVLTVRTWGINWYSPEDLANNPDAILARTPRIVSAFEVAPACDDDNALTNCGELVPACGGLGLLSFAFGLLGMTGIRRRN